MVSNNFVKYLLKNFDFFMPNLETGPSKANTIAQIVIVPAIENSAELKAVRPSFMPKGIDNFISANGVIAVKNTISSGGIGFSLCLYILSFLLMCFKEIFQKKTL